MMLESEARERERMVSLYLAHALLHTLFNTHPRLGEREEEEFQEKKKVYVCKSSLEAGRGGLYE